MHKTMLQLVRDFSRIGIDVHKLVDLKSFEEAEGGIRDILDTLIRENPENLPHILYIIDLSEEKVRKLIERSENSSADLAYAIILRCGEKVYWKERFSG